MRFTPHTENALHTGPVPGMFKEAVCVFSNSKDLQDCIRTLEGSAFPRQDISVMGQRHDLEEAFASRTVDPYRVMNDPSTPREAPARPEEQTIGASALIGGSAYVGAMAMALAAGAVALPATIVGAAVLGAAGGGAIGAVLTKVLGDHYSKNIEDQIHNGGLLLWVRTPDEHKEMLAKIVMRQHHGRDVHIQEMI
jgi:hypothetical protein